MQALLKEYWEKAMSYQDYRKMIDELLANGKTTGSNHSEDMLHYTKMNVTRMNRMDKNTNILPKVQSFLEGLNQPMDWLILTEAWCGDAAQIVPVIEQLSQVNKKKIRTRYILRDEHPELMQHFLTNGGKSIPKIIIMDRTSKKLLGDWGPRPSEVQDMVVERKNAAKPEPYQTFVVKLQKWYAKDKTKSIQKEFLTLLKSVI